MPRSTAQQNETALEADCQEAAAEEARSRDDVLSAHELEIAPRFTPEELDYSDYRWRQGDHRLERHLQTYEAGHRDRDFR